MSKTGVMTSAPSALSGRTKRTPPAQSVSIANTKDSAPRTGTAAGGLEPADLVELAGDGPPPRALRRAASEDSETAQGEIVSHRVLAVEALQGGGHFLRRAPVSRRARRQAEVARDAERVRVERDQERGCGHASPDADVEPVGRA